MKENKKSENSVVSMQICTMERKKTERFDFGFPSSSLFQLTNKIINKTPTAPPSLLNHSLPFLSFSRKNRNPTKFKKLEQGVIYFNFCKISPLFLRSVNF